MNPSPTTPSPQTAASVFSAIGHTLGKVWVPWTRREHHGKVPAVAHWTDPQCWLDESQLADKPCTADTGVGIVFGPAGVNDGGYFLTILDLDSAIVDGQLQEWAQKVLAAFPTADVYQSISGTGLHVWVRSQRMTQSYLKWYVPNVATPAGMDKKPQIEPYGGAATRFIACTGVRYRPQAPSTNAPIVSVDETLCALLGEIATRKMMGQSDEYDANIPAEPIGPPPAGAWVAERMQGSEKLAALYAGDWRSQGYPSASEGWFALVCALTSAAGFHVDEVCDALDATPWATGMIDSRQPAKYASPEWRRDEVVRAAQKVQQRNASRQLSAEQLTELIGPDSAATPYLQPVDAIKPTANVLPLVDVDDLISDEEWENDKLPPMLVADLLPRIGVGFLSGPPNVGKSLWMISLANALGAAQFFNGQKILEPVGSLILAGEGAAGLGSRLKAQRSLDGYEARGTIMLRKSRTSLLKDEFRLAVFKAQRLLGEKGRRLGIVFVDTLAANCLGFDENSSNDASRVMEIVETVAKEFGICIVLVHHGSKDNAHPVRGSSALSGAAEFILSVTDPNDRAYRGKGPMPLKKRQTKTTMTCYKARDWVNGRSVTAKIEPVQLPGHTESAAALLQSLGAVDEILPSGPGKGGPDVPTTSHGAAPQKPTPPATSSNGSEWDKPLEISPDLLLAAMTDDDVAKVCFGMQKAVEAWATATSMTGRRAAWVGFMLLQQVHAGHVLIGAPLEWRPDVGGKTTQKTVLSQGCKTVGLVIRKIATEDGSVGSLEWAE